MTEANHGQLQASGRAWRLEKPGVWMCEPWTIARVVVMGVEWFMLTRSGANEVKGRCASRMEAMQLAKSIEAMESAA
jgi:hypothetical protein